MLRILKVVFICALVVACFYFMQAMLVYGKAWLAQSLLHQAWDHAEQSGEPISPWPWSDAMVVGKLLVPSQGIDLPLLNGDHGNALAFAPGLRWISGDNLEPIALVQGHRDTHMSFVQRLEPGQQVLLKTVRGVKAFLVESLQVIDSPELTINPLFNTSTMILSTCHLDDSQTAERAKNQRLVALLKPV